jgi:hypothetical protein
MHELYIVSRQPTHSHSLSTITSRHTGILNNHHHRQHELVC